MSVLQTTASPVGRAVQNQTPSRPSSRCPSTFTTLNFYYGAKRALEDITIAIPSHLVTAFIGPSGCGKSTFLRTLNRMNDIIAGHAGRGTGPDRRRGHLRRRRRRRRAPPPRRDGVPEVEPLPKVDLRERRLRAADQRPGAQPGRAARAGRGEPASRPRSGTRSRIGCTSRRWRCRAASSSGCASRARWRSSPRSC